MNYQSFDSGLGEFYGETVTNRWQYHQGNLYLSLNGNGEEEEQFNERSRGEGRDHRTRT
ncbi:hypothetical protein PAECIP111802_02974 [Paenibacillus allorhizosphaerae]|uniref:Uncharacterized protein n=1 Tax=Paenibacillus allorhizosphaerae TaxID=2849866 RepID=A0ABM8VHW6_9BACL|nr:hypothetical protein PAECIP111802_02974 [Paenibacillus allorhizosphaerae]